MPTVFLSYSTKDHYFAELAGIKLAEAGINLWRDQGQLRAGRDWRDGIERGISDSIAVVVALSTNSAESSYVTFEWAYGLGKGKTIVPLKLDTCKIHPRIEPIQYLDFSMPGSLPWNLLIERIQEIEADATSQDDLNAAAAIQELPQQDLTVNAILAYLNQRGYQMVSYDRIRQRIDSGLTDAALDLLVDSNSTIFRQAVLKGGKSGLAKQIP
ncbi:MAG: toll/interleukin-1 receptor domain-containing protein [Planctomycetes bacterium]|nr:toll/interleukin-1 receptor domain-containing protein [Planctomycetota bacterium]